MSSDACEMFDGHKGTLILHCEYPPTSQQQIATPVAAEQPSFFISQLCNHGFKLPLAGTNDICLSVHQLPEHAFQDDEQWICVESCSRLGESKREGTRAGRREDKGKDEEEAHTDRERMGRETIRGGRGRYFEISIAEHEGTHMQAQTHVDYSRRLSQEIFTKQ
jgi:hypothetical protein